MSISQPEWVFVTFGIQHAMCMRHIVICGLPRSTVFFHITSYTVRFSKKDYWIQNLCLDFLYNLFSETFPILIWNEGDMKKMCICPHVKYPLFLSDFNETWIFSTDLRNILNVNFHENPYSGSRVPCRRTDRRTDMTKLIVDFRDFSKAPKRVKQLLYRPGHSLMVPGGWGFQISWQSVCEGGKIVSPTHRPPSPQKKIHISVRHLVDSRAIVRS
jgi:hypothetical protein